MKRRWWVVGISSVALIACGDDVAVMVADAMTDAAEAMRDAAGSDAAASDATLPEVDGNVPGFDASGVDARVDDASDSAIPVVPPRTVLEAPCEINGDPWIRTGTRPDTGEQASYLEYQAVRAAIPVPADAIILSAQVCQAEWVGTGDPSQCPPDSPTIDWECSGEYYFSVGTCRTAIARWNVPRTEVLVDCGLLSRNTPDGVLSGERFQTATLVLD